MPEPYFSTDLLGNNPNYQWVFDNSRPVYAEYAQPQYSMEIADMSNNSPATPPQKSTNWSNIGKYMKGGMNLATAALQDITDILGNTKSQINDKPSYDFSQTNTFDDLSHNNLHLASTNQLTRPTFGSSFMDINMRTARGAMAGLALGPWGALGGAIGGTLAGVGNSIAKATTYNRDINRLNRLNDQAMTNYHNDFTKAFNDINNKQINMTNLQRSRNMFAEGGNINTTIQTGGTHEENPFGGVQLGVDAQGTPNLAEEGEVVYNDYVFSNRIKPDDQILKQFNSLFKQQFNSYADAANFILNLNKERQNDYWAKQTQNKMMQNLASAQELQKVTMEAAANNMTVEEYLTAKQLQEQEQQAQVANGENYNEDPYLTNAYQSQQQQIQQLQNPMMAFGGNLFATGGPIDPPETPNYNLIGQITLNANIPQTITPEMWQSAVRERQKWLQTDEGKAYLKQFSQVNGERGLESFDLMTLLSPVGDLEDLAYIAYDIKNKNWKSASQGLLLAAVPGSWASRGYRNVTKMAHQASNNKRLYNQSVRNATDQFHRTPAGSSSAVQRGAREQQVNNFSYVLGNPITGEPPHYIYHRGPETPIRRTITNMDEEVAAVNRQLNQKHSTSKATTNSTTPQSTSTINNNSNSSRISEKISRARQLVFDARKASPKTAKLVDFLVLSAGLTGLVQGAAEIIQSHQDKKLLKTPLTEDELQQIQQAQTIVTDTNRVYTEDQKENAINLLNQYKDRPGYPQIPVEVAQEALIDVVISSNNPQNVTNKPITRLKITEALNTYRTTSNNKTYQYWDPSTRQLVQQSDYDQLTPEQQQSLYRIGTRKGKGYDGTIDYTDNAAYMDKYNNLSDDDWNQIKKQLNERYGNRYAQYDISQLKRGGKDGLFGNIHKEATNYIWDRDSQQPINEPTVESPTEPTELINIGNTSVPIKDATPVQTSQGGNEFKPQTDNNTNSQLNAWLGMNNPLRYAPVFDNARSLIEQNNPDYTYSNQLASLYQPLDYNPTGERMRYTPVDQYYLANQAEIARNTQMGAYRNNANTNQGNAYMNSMVNQQANNLIGDNYIKALQQNEQMRNQALQYNNQLDAQNETNRLNVQAQNASNYAQIMGNSYQAAEEERLAVENAREANKQNMAANLGLIGKEQSDYYNVNHNPALMYGAFGTFYKGLTPEQQKSFDNIWNNTFNK